METSKVIVCRLKLLQNLEKSFQELRLCCAICHKQSGPSTIDESSMDWPQHHANIKTSLLLFLSHLLYHLGD